MANKLIPQGVINRLRGSVIIPDFPELNVTAPFLGPDGINFSPEGSVVDYMPTLTGAVRAPAPFVMVTVGVGLLKSQSLADLYKAKIESDAAIGDVSLRTDSSTLGDFEVINCSIETLGALNFSGREAGFGVTIKGYWQVNTSLFNVT